MSRWKGRRRDGTSWHIQEKSHLHRTKLLLAVRDWGLGARAEGLRQVLHADLDEMMDSIPCLAPVDPEGRRSEDHPTRAQTHSVEDPKLKGRQEYT